jgi:hypothetical protein
MVRSANVGKRLSWPVILKHAAEIVDSYTTGVTLRQLFYRLVAALILPNLQTRYRQLSAYTAEARRAGTFPELLDRKSRILRPFSFSGPDEAKEWLMNLYTRDRTAGQEWTIYTGVEKAGMEQQLYSWFGEERHLPIVALGGYASQTLVNKVRDDIVRQQRKAVLVYAGDMDPTGEDIDRDFEARVGLFDEVVRVALDEEQIEEYELAFNPDPAVIKKLEDDPRAEAFKQRHGNLVQYELDALAPEVLMNLYTNAVAQYWDETAFKRVLQQEKKDKARLARM